MTRNPDARPAHRNTDAVSTQIIPAVSDVPSDGKSSTKRTVDPLAVLALVVFLLAVNASLLLAGAHVAVLALVSGTSAALLLLVLAGARRQGGDGR